MHSVTLKLPEALDAALRAASQRRGVSKSAVIREALEQVLAPELRATQPSQQWLARWRASLAPEAASAPDDRLAHILAKHAR
jgi:predicted transcriptional regulator